MPAQASTDRGCRDACIIVIGGLLAAGVLGIGLGLWLRMLLGL